ncbi:MAG TPA: hypothetical protein VK786_06180, partial [bacterium]|nr:hypothetical protein [bacterium]
MSLGFFGALELAFAAAALALAAWFWSRRHRSLEQLRSYLGKVESGDFGARLQDGQGGIQEALRPGLEAMVAALGERFSATEDLHR